MFFKEKEKAFFKKSNYTVKKSTYIQNFVELLDREKKKRSSCVEEVESQSETHSQSSRRDRESRRSSVLKWTKTERERKTI